jgi:predicted transcriptional regulator
MSSTVSSISEEERIAATRPITPVEEVDDFLFERNNHFPALEQAAAALRADAGIDGVCRESTLVEYLGRAHGVRVAAAPESGRHEDAFDLASRTLVLADTAPRATRRFALARLAAALFREGRPVEEALAASSLLSSEAARRRARRALWSYLAAALLMPYEEFLAAARRARYDIDYLAQRFEASYEQVCHRLVTLRRPGASGVPFGLMRIDPAGFLTKRFPLPHLPLPRHGNACPLWAGYEAFQTPGATVRQIAAFPTGERFLFLARAIEKTRPSFTLPRRLISIMLACDVLHADQIVYADGLNLSSSAPTTPVGSNCRLCVRRDCDYREEDPIIDA